MIKFVEDTLDESSSTSYLLNENAASKQEFNYSRLAHTKRVLGWARRLYGGSSCKDKLDYEAIMIAAIFHDVVRAIADVHKIIHSKAGESITKKYLLELSFSEERAEYIKWLVGMHSDKQMMKDNDIDKNLLVLMEADLLDNMGSLGVVMDCMVERGNNSCAGFEDCYDHIMRVTHHQLQVNPMITSVGRVFWDENSKLVNQFVEQMRIELSM